MSKLIKIEYSANESVTFYKIFVSPYIYLLSDLASPVALTYTT